MTTATIFRTYSYRLVSTTLRTCLRRSLCVPSRVLSQKDTSLKATERESWFTRKYRELFDGPSRKDLEASGVIFSSYCCQGVNVNDFFDYFDMPDTFYSWFLVTELHMWMVINRIMVSNRIDDAEFVRQIMITSLWQDCQIRVKLLDNIPMSERKETLTDISMEFQVSIHRFY